MLFASMLVSLAFGDAFAEAENDDDLMSFVTLPNVRALKFDITYQDRDAVAPGYWFVAPYGVIDPEVPTNRYQPCQIGPYIYDADGMLIWAGSCMFDNRNVFDFKAANNIDGQSHLSFILQHAYHDDGSDKGYGYILDQNYNEEYKVPVTNNLGAFNMHEFNVLDGGMTALACLYRSEYTDLSALSRPEDHGWILTGGLVELDTKTGEVLFEWSSFNNVLVDESVKVHSDSPGGNRPGWDYIHVNSADKNALGDYLLSGRFTSTLYYISKEGKIVWRLGGKYSDFDMDFTFSKQHHARFLESNGTHHLVSFLNNASDEGENEEDFSSALYVQLDTTASPMTARVIRRIIRPDKGLTRLRGNVQALPNGNTFVGWSERGHQSEHAADGKLLMEAKFASPRFSSYRSYKYPFTGRPSSPPDVVSSVYGTSEMDMTTVFYVSWNGATDVASWRFYARSSEGGSPVLVGETTKTDFETMYIAEGYLDWVSVEAVDRDGNHLGKSEVHRTTAPSNWQHAGFHSGSTPEPNDPGALRSADEEHEEGHEHGMDDMDMGDTEPHLDPQEAARAVEKAFEMVRGVGGLLIFILVTCSLAGLLAGVYCYLQRRRSRAYYEVPSDEAEHEPMAPS